MSARGFYLEGFKFALYLTIPVGTVMLFNNPDVLNTVISKTQYVVYPEQKETYKEGLQRFYKESLEIGLVEVNANGKYTRNKNFNTNNEEWTKKEVKNEVTVIKDTAIEEKKKGGWLW